MKKLVLLRHGESPAGTAKTALPAGLMSIYRRRASEGGAAVQAAS